jgi:hypothetical protein
MQYNKQKSKKNKYISLIQFNISKLFKILILTKFFSIFTYTVVFLSVSLNMP